MSIPVRSSAKESLLRGLADPAVLRPILGYDVRLEWVRGYVGIAGTTGVSAVHVDHGCVVQLHSRARKSSANWLAPGNGGAKPRSLSARLKALMKSSASFTTAARMTFS